MGAGATKPVAEPVEFKSNKIFAQNQEYTRVIFKQHDNDVKAISCFSSSKISLKNNSEQINISVRGAGVLRIGVTEKDPKLQEHFPEAPLFEQEDGFEPGTSERVLYYHDNSLMFCYGPPGDHMEFSPNGVKATTHVYLYVMFLYGKPTVSVKYKDDDIHMTTYETSNLRTVDDRSITVTNAEHVSIMKMKKKIEFGNVYHINWDMELSKELFAAKTPKFSFMRIGLMHGGIHDIDTHSLNSEIELDEKTTWCTESAVTQYPYSGTIALAVNKSNVTHNLLLSSVENTKRERLPERMYETPCHLFIEAASGELTIQRSPNFSVKQGLGTTYFVRDHDELGDSPKFWIQNKVGYEPYHIQYGLNPRSFVIMFNKYFTNSDEVTFKKEFFNSVKIGKFDTIQVLYKDGELSQHTIEQAFNRRQQTGGGEFHRNGVTKGKHVQHCWIIQYKNAEDARRVWLRGELDIDGVKVHILPWYAEIGEAVNYGDKPVFDDTDLVISDIDQDELRFLFGSDTKQRELEQSINKHVPASLISHQADEFNPDDGANLKLVIQCDFEKCKDHEIRATWKEIVRDEVKKFFASSIFSAEIKLDKRGYELAVKKLDEMKETQQQDDDNLVFKRNRREHIIKIVISNSELLDSICEKIRTERQHPNKKSLTINKDEVDKYRYHALDDEGHLEEVRKECSNTRFVITTKGEIELQGPADEVQSAKDKICNLAIHMSQLHEPLSEGKAKVLNQYKCSEDLQKALKTEKLSYHFRIEKMMCRLWICTNKDQDFEEKGRLLKKCINSVVHEITLSTSNTSRQSQLKKCIATMQKDTLHIHIDVKGEHVVISGTEKEVKEAERRIHTIIAETPEATKFIVLSIDVLEYMETWCEQFNKDPYNIIYDRRDPAYVVPIKINIKSTETSIKKFEDGLLQEARNIKSHWFHLSKPWIAVHREEIKDIVKAFIRKHSATIDIETAPSLIHKNISGVAVHTSIGTTCLPMCCDIIQLRVDVIIVPVYSDNLKDAKSPMVNQVINIGGKEIEKEGKSKEQFVADKPLMLDAGNLPCQKVLLVYLPPGKDVSRVEALKNCLKAVQDAFLSSVMVPIKAFCDGNKLDQSIDEIVKAIDVLVAKNSKSSLREIGLCDMQVDVVEKVEKSMKRNLKKSWYSFWHGKKVKPLKKNEEPKVVRPLSSKGQRKRNEVFWGGDEYGTIKVNVNRAPQYENESDDEESSFENQRTVIANFKDGLPYRLELTDKIQLQIIRGSIEEMDTDVIVNPSPLFPQQAGAIFNALVKKGGSSIMDECKQHGKIQPGEVKETHAGNLKCKKLYHTLQPTDWKPDTGFDSVFEIVKQCLVVAHRNQMSSIAFPAIGTGASRFPADKVAEAMTKAVFEFTDEPDTSTVQKIVIVIYYADKATVKVFEDTVPHLVSVTHTKQTDTERAGKKDTRTEIAEKQMKKLMFLPSRKPDIHTESDDLMFIKLTMKGDIKAAIRDFEDLVDKTFVKADVKYGEIEIDGEKVYLKDENLSSDEVKQIQNIEMVHNVKVTINASKRIVTLEGLGPHVNNAQFVLSDLLRLTIPTERKTTQMKADVMKHVQWLYDDNGRFLPYDEVSNFDIQFGYLNQTDFEYTNVKENKRYRVIIQTLEEHQVSDTTKKRRMVQRQKVQRGIQIPETWTIQGTEKDQELVTLDPASSEFDEVKTKFVKDGCPVNGILNVIRIEDRYKYLQYMSKKMQIDKQNPKGINNERKLWHGTDADTHIKIIKNGFDRSFAGKHATAHGKGVYFATTSRYSHGYAARDATGTCRMFLNRVLVGEYCKSDSSMTVLPEKKTVNNVKILYDSSADNPNSPSIFVIFHDTQAYPEYVIEYN